MATERREMLVSVGGRVRLGLRLGADQEFLGVGRVEVDGVALRDPRYPLSCGSIRRKGSSTAGMFLAA
jgi:hypothetical protein